MSHRLLIALALLLLPQLSHGFRQVNLIGALPVQQPVDVAVDAQGRIYAAQEKWTVTVTAPDGALLQTLGGKPAEKQEPLLAEPRGIAFIQDRVLVADRKLCRIAVFGRDGSFQGVIGREGSGLKEFDEPSALAVYGNLIFVADTDNDRIQVLGPNGVFIRVIGRSGEGDALLHKPLALSVDPQGRLHVIDGAAGAVKVYSLEGEFLSRIASAQNPSAIATDEEGIFLIEQRSFKVCKYDYSGKQLFCFGAKGSDASQFLSLDGLAVDGKGQLYVSDRHKGSVQILNPERVEKSILPDRAINPTTVSWSGEVREVEISRMALGKDGRIFALNPKGGMVVIFRDGKEEARFDLPKCTPIALAPGTEGELWVLDGGGPAILKLDMTGKVLQRFGSAGSKEGYFDKPSDLVVSPKGLVYVADAGNRRVQIFNAGGTLLKLIGNQEGRDLFARPAALALDGEENLLVLDSERSSVSVFSSKGDLLSSFGGQGNGAGKLQRPIALAVSPNEIFILNAGSQTIKVFGKGGNFLREFGSPGKDPGEFRNATALALRSDTELLVADAGNNRLQSFRFAYTPAPPEGVQATAGMRRVTLLWKPSGASYVDGYRIYRSRSRNSGFEQLAEVEKVSYTDEQVEPGIVYYYRITALAREGNESNWSAEVQAAPEKTATAPPEGISASAQEWSADLTWAPNGETFLSGYNVYREIEGKTVLLGKTSSANYYEGGLEPETTYLFEVASVSVDGVESSHVPIKVTTQVATRPPLEIAVVRIADIFSNTYKIYETDGIGRVRVTNNTRDRISRIKLSFTIKEFMDFPSEIEVADLGPRENREFTIKAVFNNQILNVTEDTPVQAELTASFYKNQELRTFSKIHTIKLFEKHRMIWDERERFSAFVTPKDPIVLEFSRSIVTQYSEFADPLLYAGVLFDALGAVGVSYLQDPSNPYQVTSGKVDFVDYLQYPRETLQRKSGDCDDLVGLYSSLLESIGIRTMVVEVPGHMFMIFAPGLEAGAYPDGLASLFIERDGQLWVPVETTLVGSPFMKAWEVGSSNYNKAAGTQLTLMDTRGAWEKFKPANLAMQEWRPAPVTRIELNSRYRDELPTLRRIRVLNLGRTYIARLKEHPGDGEILMQLGIVYAKAGEIDEAIAIFEKARDARPKDAAILHNLANAYLLGERLADAALAYKTAAECEPDDPYLWISLARCQLRLEQKAAATAAFHKALALDPAIGERYRELSLALGTVY